MKRLQAWWPMIAAFLIVLLGGWVFPTRFEIAASERALDIWKQDTTRRLERIENLLLEKK